MTNLELRQQLKQYPDDALIIIEYCNPREMKYDKITNKIYID